MFAPSPHSSLSSPRTLVVACLRTLIPTTITTLTLTILTTLTHPIILTSIVTPGWSGPGCSIMCPKQCNGIGNCTILHVFYENTTDYPTSLPTTPKPTKHPHPVPTWSPSKLPAPVPTRSPTKAPVAPAPPSAWLRGAGEDGDGGGGGGGGDEDSGGSGGVGDGSRGSGGSSGGTGHELKMDTSTDISTDSITNDSELGVTTVDYFLGKVLVPRYEHICCRSPNLTPTPGILTEPPFLILFEYWILF